jgi:hypothetical protein
MGFRSGRSLKKLPSVPSSKPPTDFPSSTISGATPLCSRFSLYAVASNSIVTATNVWYRGDHSGTRHAVDLRAPQAAGHNIAIALLAQRSVLRLFVEMQGPRDRSWKIDLSRVAPFRRLTYHKSGSAFFAIGLRADLLPAHDHPVRPLARTRRQRCLRPGEGAALFALASEGPPLGHELITAPRSAAGPVAPTPNRLRQQADQRECFQRRSFSRSLVVIRAHLSLCVLRVTMLVSPKPVAKTRISRSYSSVVVSNPLRTTRRFQWITVGSRSDSAAWICRTD